MSSSQRSEHSESRSCPEAPAPLERLERFLEAKEGEMRFHSGFLWYDGSFAFLRGKSTVVDVWVRLLKLERKNMPHFCTETQIGPLQI